MLEALFYCVTPSGYRVIFATATQRTPKTSKPVTRAGFDVLKVTPSGFKPETF